MAAQIPEGFVLIKPRGIDGVDELFVIEIRRDFNNNSSFLISHASFLIKRTNRSNKTDVSLGPAQASGWNWTEKALYSG